MLKIGWISLAFLAQFSVSQAFCGDIATPLGASDIATFISLWPETSKALAATDPEFDPALTKGLRGQLQEMAASDSKDSKLDAAVAAEGYRDFETFAALSSRIFLAAQWASNAPDEADLNAAIDGVENDQARTAAEKTEMVGALRQAYAKALAEKPADEDIALVKSFVGAIDKALAVDP